MRKNKLLFLWILFFAFLFCGLLSGCAGSVLNPYEDDFLCPDGFPGKCASVKKAYKESFKTSDGSSESFSPMVKNKSSKPKENPQKEQYSYKEELYKELAGLIKEPATPVLAPSKQMRVLIPGYTEKENVYYAHRYIYFIARDPHWTLPTIKESNLGDLE
jgi:conjugal transfer pilus assembly protein TraV